MRFYDYCKENNIHNADISKVLNISIENAKELMQGNRDFTLSQVKELCLEYGLSADEYFI